MPDATHSGPASKEILARAMVLWYWFCNKTRLWQSWAHAWWLRPSPRDVTKTMINNPYQIGWTAEENILSILTDFFKMSCNACSFFFKLLWSTAITALETETALTSGELREKCHQDFHPGCLLPEGIYCCQKTSWPKASWKGFLSAFITVHHWEKSG